MCFVDGFRDTNAEVIVIYGWRWLEELGSFFGLLLVVETHPKVSEPMRCLQKREYDQ